MVVVTIALWKKGNPNDVTVLGVAKIANDGTGDITHGNYNVDLSHAGKYLGKRKGIWKAGRVERHRKKLSPYHLVYKALKAALQIK